jgi:uncharacterized membrane protein YhfC
METGNTQHRRPRKLRRLFLLCLVAAVVAGLLYRNQGKTYMNASRQLGPSPVTDVQKIPVDVPDAEITVGCKVRVKLQEGLARVKIAAPDGSIIVDVSGGTFTWMGPSSDDRHPSGQYLIEIQTKQAVGSWQVAVFDKNHPPALDSGRLITGKLMALVGVLAAWAWRWRARADWRYFLIGGAIWAVGVGLKFGWALLLYVPVLKSLGNTLPYTAAFVAGAIYTGLLTGVFEIGVTVVAARLWPRLSLSAARGVAVGIGAGATEAVTLGVLASLWAAFGSGLASGSGGIALSATLLPVVERILALLCHAASRALVLFSAATRRWRWAWWGFALLTAVDAIAGAFILYAKDAPLSPWYLELSLVPLALVSIVLLAIMVKRWPYRQDMSDDRGAELQSDQASHQ